MRLKRTMLLLFSFALFAGLADGGHAERPGILRAVTDSSEAAVVAKVVAVDTFDPRDNGILHTTYVLKTSEVLKGKPDREFRIECIGGENADGSGMATSDSYRFEKGKTYLLFLRRKYQISLSPVLKAFSLNESGVLANENGARIIDIREDGSTALGPSGEFDTLRYGSHSTVEIGIASAPDMASPNSKGSLVTSKSDETTTQASLEDLLAVIKGFAEETD